MVFTKMRNPSQVEKQRQMMEKKMTQAEFARHIGANRSYVTQLKQAGRLVLAEDGKHVLADESIQRINQTQDPSKSGVAVRWAEKRGAAIPAAGIATDGENELGDELDDLPDDTEADVVHSVTHSQAKTTKEFYAAKMAKLDYLERKKELVRIEDVTHATATIVTNFRNTLESLPDRLAPMLAAEKEEQQIRLLMIDEIERALSQLHADLEGLCK